MFIVYLKLTCFSVSSKHSFLYSLAFSRVGQMKLLTEKFKLAPVSGATGSQLSSISVALRASAPRQKKPVLFSAVSLSSCGGRRRQVQLIH